MDDDAGDDDRLLARLVHVPDRVDAWAWRARVALWFGLAAWGVALARLDLASGAIGGSFLHGPLLVFHEAGHVLFAFLGEWMRVAGGTLGQLAMPAVLGVALLTRNRDPFGASVALWLLGVSLLDVAPYAYDALHPQLVLLSGATGEEGGHDWIYLLESLHLRPRAQSIGRALHGLGALVVLIAMAWGGWLLLRQRANVAGHVQIDLHDD